MAIYMAAAWGDVYILTDWGEGDQRPYPTCDYFLEILRLCKLNKNVERIFLVSIRRWSFQREIWRRPSDDKETGETGPEGGNGGTWNRLLGSPAFSIAPFGVGASGGMALPAGALDGTFGAVKSMLSPVLNIFSGDGRDKDPEVKPLEFPLKTDISPSPMASLPSTDDTNGEVAKAPEPQTDETSSTSNPVGPESALVGTSAIDKTTNLALNTDDNLKTEIAGGENPDFKTLLQRRRRRVLLPRDSNGPDCMNLWLTEPDSPDGSNQPSAATGAPSDPNTAPSGPAQTKLSPVNDGNVERLFVTEDDATIFVKQYDKVSQDGDYKLDIRILDSQGSEIQNKQGVDAPAGKDIEVPVPSKVERPPNSINTSASFLSPLYLTVDEDREKPIQIRYGDLFLIGPQTDWRGTFDGNDPGHDCVVSPWTDSIRNIQCNFIVAHPGS